MEKTSRAPLISGAYYKESLRELLSAAIVSAVLELLFGIISAYGPTTGIFFSGTRIQTMITIFLFASAVGFIAGHISRKSWDSRLSLPLKKSTMAASYTAAALTLALGLLLVHILGWGIGLAIRAIANDASKALPVGLMTLIKSLLERLLVGAILYAVMVIVGSIAGRVFPVLIAAAALLLLPNLFGSFINALFSSRVGYTQLFLPVGRHAMNTLELIGLILLAALTLFLAILAFSKSRVETASRPARSPAIHVLLGLAFALLLGMFVMNVAASDPAPAAVSEKLSWIENAPSAVGCVIAAAVMLTAYFVYMWISLRSFKKAASRLVFLPIAFLIVASCFAVAGIAQAKEKSIDFSVNNVDHVSVLEGSFEYTGNDDSAYYYGFGSREFGPRGRSGAERVDIKDPALLAHAARILRSDQLDTGTFDFTDPIYSILSSLFYSRYTTGVFEATLKNGAVYNLPASDDLAAEIYKAAKASPEYVERFTDVSRVSRVFWPKKLGREFEKTLFEELESLTKEQRFELMSAVSSGAIVFSEYYDLGGSDDAALDCIILTDAAYDNCIVLRLTDALPRTMALYMKLMNEKTRALADYDGIVKAIEDGDFYYMYGQLSLIGPDGIERTHFDLQGSEDAADYDREYRDYVLKVRKLLAKLVRSGASPENAEYVLGLELSDISFAERTVTLSDILTKADNGRFVVYVGLTESEYSELNELFFGGWTDEDPGTDIDAPVYYD